MQDGYVTLIRAYPWTHFCHLTFSDPITARYAHLEFERYGRRLNSLVGRVDWCTILDRSRTEHPHIHALLICPPILTIRAISGAWKAGFTEVELYRPEEGGPEYVARKIRPDANCGEFELDFSAHERRSVLRRTRRGWHPARCTTSGK